MMAPHNVPSIRSEALSYAAPQEKVAYGALLLVPSFGRGVYMQSCRAMKSPKNSCKRLTAPCLHLLEHFVKGLPDVKHIAAGIDVYLLPKNLLIQTCHAETDLATRMLQNVNAEWTVDGKPQLIKQVVITSSLACTFDVLERTSPTRMHLVVTHLPALDFHSHHSTNPVYFRRRA